MKGGLEEVENFTFELYNVAVNLLPRTKPPESSNIHSIHEVLKHYRNLTESLPLLPIVGILEI